MKSARSLSIFFMFLLLFLFQNCSGNLLSRTDHSILLKDYTSASGNGGVYDGKLNTYYRFIPNYTCNGQPSAAQIVTENEGIFAFMDIQAGQCSPSPTPIQPSDIGTSPFQKDFISVRDELFKRYEVKVNKIPDVLAEVLCRDNFENPTIELISHFNRETNEAVTRIYSQGAVVPDFQVSRLLSMDKVQYVSDQLKFSVNFSKISQPTKKFSGQIELSKISALPPQKVTCIVGGSLDTSKWKFQPLTSREVENYSILDNNVVSFSSYVARPGGGFFNPSDLHLFTTGLTPQIQVEKDLTQSLSASGFTLSYVSPTPMQVGATQLLFFSALPVNEFLSISSYLWDVANSRLVSLTNLNGGRFNSAWEAAIDYGAVKISSATEIIFPVNQIIKPVGYLRSYDSLSGQVKTLLSVSGRLSFSLLPKSNKVLTIAKNDAITEYGIFSLTSKVFRPLVVQVPDGCSLQGDILDVLKNELGFLQALQCDNSATPRIAYVSLVDGSLQSFATTGRLLFTSNDSKWAFFKVDTTRSSIIVNLENLRIQSSPIYPNYGSRAETPFFEDGLWYGMDSGSAKPRLIQTDLRTQTSTTLCEQAQGTITSVGALSTQKVYIFTYDSSQKIYRFYQAKGANECTRINEFPSTNPLSYVKSTTEVGFAVVLLARSPTFFHSNPNEIVFVPTDGRPPLKLSSGTVDGSWTIAMTPDNKSILIGGPDQNGKSSLKVFNYKSAP